MPAAELVILALFAISLMSPVTGLLIVAALAPLGSLIAAVMGAPHVRVSDAIAVAFLGGWLLRRLPQRRGPSVAAPSVGWLLIALIVASAAGVGLFVDGERRHVVDAARLLTGIALVAATVALFRQRPELSLTLPVALAASATAAAVWIAIPWSVAGGFTISAPAGQAAAFCAYFALAACLALGMTLRARGRARIAWATASGCLLVGLFAATSRASAIGADADALSPFTRTRLLIDASLRTIASRPLFGVGIGREASVSPLFFSPRLSWNGGAAGTHNLLVLGVELGLVGLALWLAWIGAGFLRVARALAIDRRDTRLWGAASGVAAFVAGMAASRPLAFSETVVPFLLQFGLMTALAGSTLLNASAVEGSIALAHAATRWPRRRVAVTVLSMSAIAAGALVSAGRGPVDRPPSDVDGCYGWETAKSGERFRRTEQYASVFVPADVTTVRLPLRATAAPAAPPLTVAVKTGAGTHYQAAADNAWRILDIALPAASSGQRVHRIDLRTSRPDGVQVGELQLVR